VTARFQTLFWADYSGIPVEFTGLGIGSTPLLSSALAAVAKPTPNLDDPTGSAWVRETIFPVSRSAYTFTEDRELERAIYDVFTTWGTGRGHNTDICDSIISYYSRVTAAGLIYTSPDGELPERRWIGRTDEGWMHQQVLVPIALYG